MYFVREEWRYVCSLSLTVSMTAAHRGRQRAHIIGCCRGADSAGRDRKGQEGKVIHTNYLTTVDIAGFTGIQEHLTDDRSVSHVAACQQTGISVTIRCINWLAAAKLP